MIRVAINGFGRIGRNAFKVALEEFSQDIEIVAINDLTESKVLAHLLQYDTAYGQWEKRVTSDEHSLIIDEKHYPIYAIKEPTELPWKDLNVDVVIESTGRFTDEAGMQQHITAGAKRVVLSAPAKDGNVGTFLMGVNQDKYQNQELINNASCTSNCLAPVIAIINEKFGIAKALYTTVHSVTAEQNLVDGPPPGGKSGDLRRARAAYANMIPTTTGAAIAVTQAIPEMKDFIDGRAIRVPTITGSITDFTVLLKRKTTVEEINQAIKDACNEPRWKGIAAWTEDPIVSSDIIGRSESCIMDLALTQIVDGDLVKLFAWYDNEWGYSNRLVEQVLNVGKTIQQAPTADTSNNSPIAPSFPVATTSEEHEIIPAPEIHPMVMPEHSEEPVVQNVEEAPKMSDTSMMSIEEPQQNTQQSQVAAPQESIAPPAAPTFNMGGETTPTPPVPDVQATESTTAQTPMPQQTPNPTVFNNSAHEQPVVQDQVVHHVEAPEQKKSFFDWFKS